MIVFPLFPRKALQCFFAFLFTLCAFSTPALADTPTIERPIAVLRALDKVTGRVAEFEIEIGKPYRFGALFMTVNSCRVTTPEEAPESAAFFDVSEFVSERQQQITVFSGWLFASSPALSAMEHPVYDLWLIGCKGKGSEATKAQKSKT